MKHLIAYDITCPRRLQKAHRYLSQHAIPLQNSIFLHLGSHEQAQQCFTDLSNILHSQQDNLRFYFLPNHTQIHSLGKIALPTGVILGELTYSHCQV